MIVLAHRGNLRGPAPGRENSLALIGEALSLGFGLETDVRYSAGHGFYISHDVAAAAGGAALLGAHCELWQRHPGAPVALNIKELGREGELLAALRAMGVMPQVFLFDMELIEPNPGETARLYRRLDPSVAIAARVSDRGEPLERALGIEVAGVIWLDEFDGPWATADTVRKLKNAGKAIYAVSPELHGGRVDEARARWRDFARWGVDGICTDWPELLQSDLSAMFKTGT
jgi:glycerophosphoryl diester phosphodiesterase